MTNPFMAALGGGQGPMGNFAQMVQQFNQFKANSRATPKPRSKSSCRVVG